MTLLDETHDPAGRSWVPGADDHPDFPIQNLPFGVFSDGAGGPRGGVAIGGQVFDLAAGIAAGLFSGEALRAAEAASAPALNGFLALGAGPRRALRRRLFAILLRGSADEAAARGCLREAAQAVMHLPARIGDYTDFYAGIHHATRVGSLFRPDSPLLPNYKHVPIGYHGRASSIRASGEPVRRPNGQTRAPDAEAPSFGPSRRLDYELELAMLVGPGNELGIPVPVGEAGERIGGLCLLNDWSARDIQAWEYQPLGPFLAKSFAATVSAWVITPEALAPFRIAQDPRPAGDPRPLPYLTDAADAAAGALDLELQVLIMTPGLRARGLPAQLVACSNARHMYWTPAQMIAHHTSNGCDLRPGDLLGTGTLSGPGGPQASGSLLEATNGGKDPIHLASGEQRLFVEDGDEVILTARGRREGFASIGFGDCRAVVLPARG